MKKYVGFILLFGLVVGVGATLTLTDIPNEAGPHKIKTTVNANNTLTETSVNANLASIAVNLGYFTAQTDTNTSVTATESTPRFVGDTLIGTVSNIVWRSESTTTDSWIQVSN